MNRGLVVLVFLFFQVFCLSAAEAYSFRVYLSDKGESGYTIDKPEEFLSPEAIARRLRKRIGIDSSDLPIASSYLQALTATGGKLVTQSKWLSTVVLSSPDSLLIDRLQELAIVDSVKCVWRGEREETKERDREDEASCLLSSDTRLKAYYGYGEPQIKMLNGIKLHERGFTGEGVSVAVIDAGFMHVDRINAFDSLRLAGTYNFVSPGESVFEADDHGTKVLSCLAANLPGVMVGTAPHASYWLLKSEDERTEYPVEEDYWAAAVEFADSVGVDVISSSLGYSRFDEEGMSYGQEALDGKTTLISRIATCAAEKGLFVFCSAGNEGNNPWEKITFPSDAEGIVTIGAITDKKEKSSFSSIGFTSDYRVKPDLVALGSGNCVIDAYGNVRYANGTSFATPILAGLGICLYQALPTLTHKELITLLQESSSQYKRPDAEKGYGIPDVYKTYKKGLKYVHTGD